MISGHPVREDKESRGRRPPVLARESLALQPLAQNVRRARRTVVDALVSANRADLADTAALVTSEIVTNAILHAGSDIWVTVTVTAEGALVEVEDHSPHLPAQRAYDSAATTGRGMALVNELVSDFGVRQIPDNGKIVWFTLGIPRGAAAPHPRQLPLQATVTLPRVPVGLYCSFQQMADGLLREYVLVHFNQGRDDAALAEWNRANEAFGELALGGAAAFAERDGGATHIDLVFGVGAGGREHFAALRRVLDLAGKLAARGKLLAPPSQPEIAALRNWCCDQVIRQLAGEPAVAWQSGQAVVVPLPGAVTWDAAAVWGADTAVVAADDANRMIAVSAPAAELLGWQVEELVGQRIVAIVPAVAREAHIAGFVRYLVSGEARVIGHPVGVSALRRDGTEVAVTLLVSMARESDRPVFLATLTPLV